jgi:hypothetical protein
LEETVLGRNASASWLNKLSDEGKHAALGKGVAHWGGAIVKRCCWQRNEQSLEISIQISIGSMEKVVGALQSPDDE